MQCFSSGFLSNSPINFVVSCSFRLEIQCASAAATTTVVRTAAVASARRGCPCRKQRARRALISGSPSGPPYPDSPPARATAKRARSWNLPWEVRLNALWLLQPWGTLLQAKIAALHTALSKKCWERRGREMRTRERRATRMKGSCSKRWFEMAFKTHDVEACWNWHVYELISKERDAWMCSLARKDTNLHTSAQPISHTGTRNLIPLERQYR